jgi:hypothetical protein
MRDNPLHTSWQQAVAGIEFAEEDDRFVKTTAETYKRLKKELEEMPGSEVDTLPVELKDWIYSLRPELALSQPHASSSTPITQVTNGETEHKKDLRQLVKGMAGVSSFPSGWDFLKKVDFDLGSPPG